MPYADPAKKRAWEKTWGKAYHARWYQRLKAAGLCVICGRRKAEGDYVRCDICGLVKARRHTWRRYPRRKRKGDEDA